MYKTISLKQKVWTRYSTIGYTWLAAFAVIFVAIFFNRNNGLANRLVDEKPLNGPSPERSKLTDKPNRKQFPGC